MKKIIIAIDGVAASGKSTTAKHVARKLKYTYIDTGAMYRALTLKVLRLGLMDMVFSDTAALQKLLAETKFVLEGDAVWIDGENVSGHIRTTEIAAYVSKISSLKPVREKLAVLQKEMGQHKGVVMDGRDIGTTIFPNAELKIFMTANARERALRRYAELKEKSSGDPELSLDELEADILRRDAEDARRPLSPLRQPDDAIVLDTSSLSIEKQVEFIYTAAVKVIGE
ncbi:MAG: (d)CMP kinase [Rhizobacter sp.]|nr:(d)CMP kinase [Chlorobiales bacterium]